MSYYVDAHSHIDLLQDVQKNWKNEDALPVKTISVTNAPFIFDPCKKLFGNARNLRVALGLHPELVNQYGSQIPLFEKLIDDTKYVGEVGLDGSSRFIGSFEHQKKVFVEILKLCRKSDNKIITVHTRNAASETIDLLDQYLADSNCQVIFHWYSGNRADLKIAIGKGYYFSINHKMLYAEKGKDIIMSIPNHLLLTETDAPFTFDNTIKSRIESLRISINGISLLMKKETIEIKENIYSNFKTMLEKVS